MEKITDYFLYMPSFLYTIISKLGFVVILFLWMLSIFPRVIVITQVFCESSCYSKSEIVDFHINEDLPGYALMWDFQILKCRTNGTMYASTRIIEGNDSTLP